MKREAKGKVRIREERERKKEGMRRSKRKRDMEGKENEKLEGNESEANKDIKCVCHLGPVFCNSDVFLSFL